MTKICSISTYSGPRMRAEGDARILLIISPLEMKLALQKRASIPQGVIS